MLSSSWSRKLYNHPVLHSSNLLNPGFPRRSRRGYWAPRQGLLSAIYTHPPVGDLSGCMQMEAAPSARRVHHVYPSRTAIPGNSAYMILYVRVGVNGRSVLYTSAAPDPDRVWNWQADPWGIRGYYACPALVRSRPALLPAEEASSKGSPEHKDSAEDSWHDFEGDACPRQEKHRVKDDHQENHQRGEGQREDRLLPKGIPVDRLVPTPMTFLGWIGQPAGIVNIGSRASPGSEFWTRSYF